jgi:hypothetical protein
MPSMPPTNSSALPVDSTRRRLLTIAAGGAVAAVASAPAIAIAAPVRPDTTKAGPALRAALVAMNEANDALTAANAVLEAGVATVNQWEEEKTALFQEGFAISCKEFRSRQTVGGAGWPWRGLRSCATQALVAQLLRP